MDEIMGQGVLPPVPEGEVSDTRDVFQAVEPDMARATHARRLSEKSAAKGQRPLRPEREKQPRNYQEQSEYAIARPKRVAKLAPIKVLREVYIPKLVTIGNLAKILNVRLGKRSVRLQSFPADQLALAPLQRALLKAGFEDVNYDHCTLCVF